MIFAYPAHVNDVPLYACQLSASHATALAPVLYSTVGVPVPLPYLLRMILASMAPRFHVSLSMLCPASSVNCSASPLPLMVPVPVHLPEKVRITASSTFTPSSPQHTVPISPPALLLELLDRLLLELFELLLLELLDRDELDDLELLDFDELEDFELLLRELLDDRDELDDFELLELDREELELDRLELHIISKQPLFTMKLSALQVIPG